MYISMYISYPKYAWLLYLHNITKYDILHIKICICLNRSCCMNSIWVALLGNTYCITLKPITILKRILKQHTLSDTSACWKEKPEYTKTY